MSRVSIYLNTLGRTREQFDFYGAIFGTQPYAAIRVADLPDQAPLAEDEQDALIHIELEILGGTILMGTDLLASRGHELAVGNNVWINLEPDTLAEAERLFGGLSEGASDVNPLSLMFWGDHWGSLVDRYGIRWMVNVRAAGPA